MGNAVSASAQEDGKDEIIKESNNVAKKYGLKPTQSNEFQGERLSFDSPEEFEEFLKGEKNAQNLIQPLANATTNPKSCQTNLTGQICVQATVKKNGQGYILGVSNVHSYQSGVVFGITWSQIDTGKSYSGKSGSAWALGQKTYGVDIGGFPAGYTKKEKMTVNF